MTRYREVRVHSRKKKWTWYYAVFEAQSEICLYVPEVGAITLPTQRLEDLTREDLGDWAGSESERVEIGPIQEHPASPEELHTGHLFEMACGFLSDPAPSPPKKTKRAVAKV
jgi:hypothetical protein